MKIDNEHFGELVVIRKDKTRTPFTLLGRIGKMAKLKVEDGIIIVPTSKIELVGYGEAKRIRELKRLQQN